MKKIWIIAIIFISFASVSASAQCGDDMLKTALKEMGEAQYMKDFTIDLKKAKVDVKTGYLKFSVILNSRSHYKFNTVNGLSNASGVIMQLYDGDKMLVSNFEAGKMYDSFEFICRKSKVYNIMFSFKGGEEGCAKAVMSLVKQYSQGEMNF